MMYHGVALSPEDAERLKDHKQRFYVPVLDLSDSTKEVLVKYSKIAPDQLQTHVEGIVRLGCRFALIIHSLM